MDRGDFAVHHTVYLADDKLHRFASWWNRAPRACKRAGVCPVCFKFEGNITISTFKYIGVLDDQIGECCFETRYEIAKLFFAIEGLTSGVVDNLNVVCYHTDDFVKFVRAEQVVDFFAHSCIVGGRWFRGWLAARSHEQKACSEKKECVLHF